MAGLALVALVWVWWRAWSPLVAGDAAALCLAGLGLGVINFRFWHGCYLAGPGCGMTRSCVLGASFRPSIWATRHCGAHAVTSDAIVRWPCPGTVPGAYKAMYNVLLLRQVGGHMSPILVAAVVALMTLHRLDGRQCGGFL